jgi:hypothetical protein
LNTTGQSKTTFTSFTCDRWPVPSPTLTPSTFGGGCTML